MYQRTPISQTCDVLNQLHNVIAMPAGGGFQMALSCHVVRRSSVVSSITKGLNGLDLQAELSICI